jgi:hypothetical protein
LALLEVAIGSCEPEVAVAKVEQMGSIWSVGNHFPIADEAKSSLSGYKLKRINWLE